MLRLFINLLLFSSLSASQTMHHNVICRMVQSDDSQEWLAMYLREHPVDLDARLVDTTSEYNYYTPLMIAAAKGHENQVRLLLDAGASVNIQIVTACSNNINGFTALMFAVLYRRTNVVECLLEHGADPALEQNWLAGGPRGLEDIEAGVRFSRTAFNLAVELDQNDLCRLLLDAGNTELVNKKDSPQGLSPFTRAIQRRNWKLCSLILRYNPTIDASERAHQNEKLFNKLIIKPLLICASEGQADLCHEMMRRSCRVPEPTVVSAVQRSRIISFLMCLNRLCPAVYNKNLRVRILVAEEDMARSVINLLLLRKKNGRPIAQEWVSSVAQSLASDTINALVPLAEEAYVMSNEEVRKVVNPVTFQKKYVSAIYENCCVYCTSPGNTDLISDEEVGEIENIAESRKHTKSHNSMIAGCHTCALIGSNVILMGIVLQYLLF